MDWVGLGGVGQGRADLNKDQCEFIKNWALKGGVTDWIWVADRGGRCGQMVGKGIWMMWMGFGGAGCWGGVDGVRCGDGGGMGPGPDQITDLKKQIGLIR